MNDCLLELARGCVVFIQSKELEFSLIVFKNIIEFLQRIALIIGEAINMPVFPFRGLSIMLPHLERRHIKSVIIPCCCWDWHITGIPTVYFHLHFICDRTDWVFWKVIRDEIVASHGQPRHVEDFLSPVIG